MNKLIIIGNLTRDPELRTIPSGDSVCTFTVAVNRRRKSNDGSQPEADFFRVSAWRQLGEVCAKFLAKGRKVCVVGTVSARMYDNRDGGKSISLEVNADDVEFLSSRNDEGGTGAPSAYTASAPAARPAPQPAASNGFVQVDEDDLPF